MSDTDRVKPPSYDETRATAILNTAIKHNFFPEGGVPESAADKIVEAEKIMAMTQQAVMIANNVGHGNVPQWPAIEAVWYEGTVLVGANGDGTETSANGSEAPPAPPVPAAEQPQQLPSPPDSPSSPPAAPLQASATEVPPPVPSPRPQTSAGAGAERPAPLEVWADAGAGRWLVQEDLGDFGLEVVSETTGQVTVVPPSLLQVKLVEGTVSVWAKPEDNALYYKHDGCTTWIVPLDGMALPVLGSAVECSECARVMPIVSVEANGYGEPDPPAQEPESQPVAIDSEPTDPEPALSSPSEQQASEFVDDDEGDAQYAKVLEDVDRDWHPSAMPVPVDVEAPLAFPEDITEDLLYNRRLHGERNALAARARYLYGVEHAKVKGCGRVRKMHFKRAFAEARVQLGSGATVTDVKELAEQDDEVVRWDERIATHTGRADAYRTFMEMYAEDVTTLSRDLTWAGAEEKGS